MGDIISAFPSPIILNAISENTDDLKKELSFIRNSYQGDFHKNCEYRVLEKYPRIKKILLKQFKQVA